MQEDSRSKIVLVDFKGDPLAGTHDTVLQVEGQAETMDTERAGEMWGVNSYYD